MIDSHQHFWQYSQEEYGWINEEMNVIKKSFLPPDLEPQLKALEFSGCIAVQARQSNAENNFLLELANAHDFILGVVGWIDLLKDEFEPELEQYKINNYLKGFRHVLQDEPDPNFMLNQNFVNNIKKAQKEGFSYDLLIYEKQLKTTVKFLNHFSDETFILDHIAKPDILKGQSKNWKEGIKQLSEYPNIYCKLSGMVTETKWNSWRAEDFYPYLDHIISCFGTERVMFGSDWPVCLLSADQYKNVFNIIKDYSEQFSEAEQLQIFSENVKKAYNLS